ncbi:hypothetical protein [Lactobacillus delbrueckii]|uniref:hypothetical protein n=1 Tax=Lactobacillus delbrueckii TaxID=1584 RepID=UPI000B0D7F38|nr:hypothetical protein [Lactobacillus delbrueckii]
MIIKTVNCLMFLAEAVLICFMGAELVGFQTKAKDLTIGWSLIIASVALVLAAILIWTSKFSVLFWITEVALSPTSGQSWSWPSTWLISCF